jgi:hypothetical protein
VEHDRGSHESIRNERLLRVTSQVHGDWWQAQRARESRLRAREWNAACVRLLVNALLVTAWLVVLVIALLAAFAAM